MLFIVIQDKLSAEQQAKISKFQDLGASLYFSLPYTSPQRQIDLQQTQSSFYKKLLLNWPTKEHWFGLSKGSKLISSFTPAHLRDPSSMDTKFKSSWNSMVSKVYSFLL
ncbi:hypothetical protein BB560_002027 [Smittium megazygosporum]|uniref:Uncharacterized protein n=1 Tax=Smittium megazygosporum TaxID=133381 RepID=A0A2T9ZFW6_9FUNG|nr:hypothetical protein BB560_002027 [Smittium megazygosporum]